MQVPRCMNKQFSVQFTYLIDHHYDKNYLYYYRKKLSMKCSETRRIIVCNKILQLGMLFSNKLERL